MFDIIPICSILYKFTAPLQKWVVQFAALCFGVLSTKVISCYSTLDVKIVRNSYYQLAPFGCGKKDFD